MMDRDEFENLPGCVREYIDLVLKKMRYRGQVRCEVRAELLGHFVDGLADCEDAQDRESIAEKLVVGFGDITMLGKLIKRGKKRCRPLWQKVLLRGLYTLCALIAFIILYGVWFFMGGPTLSIDYLARFNEMTRPVAAAGENAWSDYDKAIELYVAPDEIDKGRGFTEGEELPDKRRLTEIVPRTSENSDYVSYVELGSEEQTAIIEWIDLNEEAWAHYVEASRKEYCYREYRVGDEEGHPMLISVQLPHLSEIRDMARLGVWRSEKQIHQNKPEEAAETCLTIIRSGLHWHHHKGMLMEQLVGQAIVRLGLEQIVAMVAKDELSSDEITRAQQELAAIFKDDFPHMTVRYEQLIFEDMVQHVFTDGGPGGGHIIPKMLFQIEGDDAELEDFGRMILHAGRNKTLALGNKLYGHMEKTVKMSPWEKRAGNTEDFLAAYSEQRYAFIWWITPAIDRVSEVRYQGKALYDAVLTILALKRWEINGGALPESLRQLKEAGYLKELPDDPYSEGLLTYARRNGDFVLYSAGHDFDDDGGKQNPESEWGRDEEGGDRVFWPVE